MAETTDRAQLVREDVLFEEAFLLQVQCCIQELLNDKRLKYRDLSKRLGVSEARVSQMFGDDASNLTIRTIARIFYQLGEKPVLLSQRECDRLGSRGTAGLRRVDDGRDGCRSVRGGARASD